MYKIERQDKILNIIKEQERASVTELSEKFHVSKVTIRADIDDLEKTGMISKTHGGAVIKDSNSFTEIPYEIKKQKNTAEKKKIAKEAIKYIQPGDVIILDSGSTIFQMAADLPEGIIVITTDIMTAAEIAKTKKDIRVLLPGGELERSVYTIEGIDTIRFFETLSATKCFIGCDGLDFEFGITDRSREYAAVKRAMIKAASYVILAVDSSKIGTKMGSLVESCECVDAIITDYMSKDNVEFCGKKGIEVVIAK